MMTMNIDKHSATVSNMFAKWSSITVPSANRSTTRDPLELDLRFT